MKKTSKMLIALSILASTLFGCTQVDNQGNTEQSVISDIPVMKNENSIETSTTTVATTPVTTTTTTKPSIVADFIALDAEQQNSIALLNYMSVLSYEINASKNSRVYLDDVYSSLYNDINPGTVDARTQSQLSIMLDTLEEYRMLNVKRERIEYIYENNKGSAFKSAVPNPIDVLNVVSSNKPLKAIISTVNLVAGAYGSYTEQTESIELQNMKDGWALDDEEAVAVHESRKTAFNYMISMVRDNSLPGELALSESDIEEFVNAKNNTNIVRRIQFLESNIDKYKCLGSYWIVLADSYYNNGDYQECLDAISVYQELSPQIYRKDKEFASILPKAIDAAYEIFNNDEYVSYCEKCCELIIDNTDSKDWSLKYFAAIAYMDLHRLTSNREYLELAYNITLDNVNYCIDEQIALNQTYLADIKEIETPKDATERIKNEIKQYNKYILETRKAELPPVSEPLYINCELLFALAGELDISESDKDKIEGILYGNENPVFLTSALENQFSFKNQNTEIDLNSIKISFDGKKINLPANLLTSSASIEVVVKDGENDTMITDWKIENVERVNKDDMSTFIAHYSSEEIKNVSYTENSTITIIVTPKSGNVNGMCSFEFKAKPTKFLFLQTGYEFIRI